MTDATRRALRELCEKATPGPWAVDGDGRDICGFRDRLGGMNGKPPYEITGENGFQRFAMADDAAFIAAARTALPELLDALDAAEIQRDMALNRIRNDELNLPADRDAARDAGRAAGYREGVEAAEKVVERGGCTCGCVGDIRALSPAPVADAGADETNKETSE